MVPDAVDDPGRPSGGNVYDRHLAQRLPGAGWEVHEHALPPGADVEQIPADAVVLVDGLVAATALPALHAHGHVVALIHLPLGDDRERAFLRRARAVVTTSDWGRRRLIELHGLPAEKLHVATPGVETTDLAAGTAGGGALLCVAAVTPVKGHDVLIDALDRIRELAWRCECVGSLERDARFARELQLRAPDNVSFPGPRTGPALDRSYASADVLVLASRIETFGMVVTEALARGLPAIATAVGGLPEALGRGADGTPPGLLVAPGDPAALAGALRDWLADPALRSRLRAAARERRATLSGWSATAAAVSAVLDEVAA